MKMLKKIKLINWQTFWNNTIDVSGNILLTGENGAGKTSFLDAINYVLNGGSNTKFNLAASDETTRSLLTYIRGEIGIEGKQALRMGDNVISHICLEYFDDSNGQSFLIGGVFEIRDNSVKVDQAFYHISNAQLKEELFSVEDNGNYSIVNFKILSNKAKEIYGEACFEQYLGNKSQIKMAIASTLGIQTKKYHELLAKALAFKPISDVNNFVFNFLLPQENVSVDSVKSTIRSYLKIKGSVEFDQRKQISLKDIISSVEKYNGYKEEYTLLETYLYKTSADTFNNLINSKKRKIENNEKDTVELNNKIESMHHQEDEINKRILQVETADWYQAIADEEKVLLDAVTNRTKANEDLNSYNLIALSEASLASEFGIKNNIRNSIIDGNFSSFEKEINRVNLLLDKEKDKKYSELQSLRAEKSSVVENQTKLLSDINSLEQGLAVYPRSVKTLMEIIRQGLNNKYGEEIDAIPFCELIEIKEGEEKWRDALEGYLNTRRFDLFVPSRYFDDSVSLYEKFKYDFSIEGVGLVNHSAIKEKEIKTNSLATKVVTDDKRAQAYINYLLGDIICVDSEAELKNYESAINPTCLVYKNKTVRQTKFEVYKTPFIGQNSRLIQKEQKIDELSSLDERNSSLNKEIATVVGQYDKLKNSKLSTLIGIHNYWEVFEEAKQKEDDVRKVLEKLKIENGSLINDTTSFKQELENIRKTIFESSMRVGELAKENSLLIQDIENHKEEYNRNVELLEDKLKNPQISIKFDDFAKDIHLTVDQTQSKIAYERELVNREVNHLTLLMNNYINEFNFDSSPSVANIKDFEEEYNLIVKRELSKYREELENAMEECSIAFKENYIAQIRQHIREEKDNIKKLNKILESKPFGTEGEVYQFVISKSTDPSFGKYYEIFDSDEDFDARDLFINQLSDKNLSLMKDLFDSLTSDANDEKQAAVLAKFTDYRNFMNYDIMITDKHGNKSFYSKIGKGKSGGETQTPFYVIIAASFDQIISSSYQKKSSAILVIMDEAFNKMDASHIKATMEYFNDLNIQLLISLPSNNAKILMPFVDTTLGLVKSNNVSYIRSDIRK